MHTLTARELAARKAERERLAFAKYRALRSYAETQADRATALALASGTAEDRAIEISVKLEKSIFQRERKANKTGAAAKADRHVAKRLATDGIDHDSASRIMLPRDKGALRPYGFTVHGSNTKRGGARSLAYAKAQKMHLTTFERARIMRLIARLDTLDANLAQREIPSRLKNKWDKEKSHITAKLERV